MRALKNSLSSYINLVRKGEVIIVKDRNKVVAEIRKPAPEESQEEHPYIREAILNGSIRPASRKKTNIDNIVKKYSGMRIPGVDFEKIRISLKED